MIEKILVNYCKRNLALSNGHARESCTPKRPSIENKASDNRTFNLDVVCVEARARNRTPFMA